MKQQYRELLPEWWNEREKHDLVLSDDLDSLASCMLLQKQLGWKIKYFYDFEHIYAATDYDVEKNKRCWVDVAIRQGHAIDNHVSALKLTDEWNSGMINLNLMQKVSNENYTDKYSGSTLLEVWSLLDYPLPKTEKGMMILLAIDTTFKGFYSNNFHDTQKHYLVDILGFDELYKVIQRHEKDEFYELIAKYGLNAKINFKENKFETRLLLETLSELLEIDLELPTDEFFLWKELEIIESKTNSFSIDKASKYVFTVAVTYKNSMRYSKIIPEEKRE